MTLRDITIPDLPENERQAYIAGKDAGLALHDPLSRRLRQSLLRLLKVASPDSREAEWAADMLELYGLDGDLDPRPRAVCPLCGDFLYQHRRSHCTAMRSPFEACPCPGHTAAVQALKAAAPAPHCYHHSNCAEQSKGDCCRREDCDEHCGQPQ